MSPLIVAGICGMAGGALAAVGALAILLKTLQGTDCLTISRGPKRELYRDIEVLEHAPRPQGLYVRFRNRGEKAIAMAHFKVSGFRDGKLWAELEETAYSETPPGEENEVVLKLLDYRDREQPVDFSDCRVEVKPLYGHTL